MSFYTDWFLAGVREAKAIASIATTEKHSFDDWPHLSLPDVGEMELSALWDALCDDDHSDDSVTDDLLFQEDDEVFVSRVEPEFIKSLAAVEPATIKPLAKQWRKSAELAEWKLADVERVLRELVEFAARACRERKPVLQLSVL